MSLFVQGLSGLTMIDTGRGHSYGRSCLWSSVQSPVQVGVSNQTLPEHRRWPPHPEPTPRPGTASLRAEKVRRQARSLRQLPLQFPVFPGRLPFRGPSGRGFVQGQSYLSRPPVFGAVVSGRAGRGVVWGVLAESRSLPFTA